jgi:subtilase family serine protease
VAPLQAGSYTLRAFVDSAGRTAEGDESNNQTTLAYQARSAYVDLEVVDVDVAPLWPLPLGSLTTYVTLQNRGNVASPATRLSVWSNQVDEAACGAPGLYKTVKALSPWTPRRETVTGLKAPGAAGDYVLRAFVDSTCALAETTETNNQGTLQYTVYNPTPNLTVAKIALSVSRPRAGQTFVATVSLKNIGTGPAAAGRVGVWLNRVTAPGLGDTPDAYIDTVSPLAAGASTSLKVAGLLAPAAGARTIFAMVDANGGTAELSEADDTLSLQYTVLP